ncbi:MAG: hypothetical protein NVS1B3_08930 [Candidatus Dormibacteraceae bacterium]
MGLEDGGDQVGLDALAAEYNRPAFYTHGLIVLGAAESRPTRPSARPLRGPPPSPFVRKQTYQVREGSTVAAWSP